jgi:hypothetical protein
MMSKVRLTTVVAGAALSVVTPAHAQILDRDPLLSADTCTFQAQVIQWDLPDEATAIPGAVAMDRHESSGSSSHSIWMVTRAEPRVFRLDTSHKKAVARYTTWTLAPDSLLSGGIKKLNVSSDRRFVAVRTTFNLQAVDTSKCTKAANGSTECERLVFNDLQAQIAGLSDVAVDTKYNIYTTVSLPVGAAEDSFVERVQPTALNVDPLTGGVSTTVRRWPVGGGAPLCSVIGCISGIAVGRRNSALVYYAEPVKDAIGELNTSTGKVRRFLLAAFGVDEPRQINVDDEGIVWAVTGSGHLVRIDPERNLVSTHLTPGGGGNELFGVAPDRGGSRRWSDADFRNEFVGYTASLTNLVGVLIPDGVPRKVLPVIDTVYPKDVHVKVMRERAVQQTRDVMPIPRTIAVTATPKDDGTYLEADITQLGDQQPLGIVPVPRGKIGSFFYAVGLSPAVNRIERITLPRLPRRPDSPRDHDDFDDDGKRDDADDDIDDDGMGNAIDKDNDNDCLTDDVDDDDDGDGLEDKHDRRDRDERKYTHRGTAGAGSSLSHSVAVASGTTLLTVLASAADFAAPLSIDIVDPLGVVVSQTLPTPGNAVAATVPLKAGLYTVRVKNNGLATTNVETTTITEALPGTIDALR